MADWTSALITSHGSPWLMIGIALLVFPKLALGLSGFETGVAVMPQVEGDAGDDRRRAPRTHPRHPHAADRPPR